MRTLALWCPDWPVIAAGLTEGVAVHGPVAVLRARRVLACSPAARAAGVRRGLRQREAQGRCPELVVIEHDPGRDARAFEPVIAAIEQLAPGVEVLRPGACALAARGPSGYFGGEAQAAERLVEHIAVVCAVEAQAGIAEGLFAAMLAARSGRIVPPGATPDFLGAMDISTLDRPDLVDLLRRLGVRTLAEFTALPVGDVLARFGFDAAHAHRLATGDDARPVVGRRLPPDLVVEEEYDPPLERVDMATFAAKALAERLHTRLAGYGLAATHIGIEAHTAAGEELYRMWRHDGVLDAAALADRVRWQLDGWLTGAGRSGVQFGYAPTRPTAGLDRLRLIPGGVVRYSGLQAGLWGATGVADERAHRALVRVQGLLGPDSVFTAVLGGGRSYADRVRYVAWGDERSPVKQVGPPWPGQLPAPAPASVLTEPSTIEVSTADGVSLAVDSRLALNGSPVAVAIDGRRLSVVGWSGPWRAEERWWARAEASQLVRFQLLLDDGRALLVASNHDHDHDAGGGRWAVEAIYD